MRNLILFITIFSLSMLTHASEETVDWVPEELNQPSIDPSCVDNYRTVNINKCGIRNLVYNTCSPLNLSYLDLFRFKYYENHYPNEPREIDPFAIESNLIRLKSCESYKHYKDNYNISPLDIIPIKRYTGSSYMPMNFALRLQTHPDGTLDQCNETKRRAFKKRMNPINSLLSKTLNKLPIFMGTVYRNFSYSKKLKRILKAGKIITLEGFTSSSLNKYISYKGNYKTNKLIIKSRNGRYIKPLSLHQEEYEVLFQPDTKFKVTKVEKGIYDQWLIYLDEIVDEGYYNSKLKLVEDTALIKVERNVKPDIRTIYGSCNTFYRINENNTVIKEFKKSHTYKVITKKLNVLETDKDYNCVSCILQRLEDQNPKSCNEVIDENSEGLLLSHKMLILMKLEDLKQLNSRNLYDQSDMEMFSFSPQKGSLSNIIPEREIHEKGINYARLGFFYKKFRAEDQKRTNETIKRWEVLKWFKYTFDFLPRYKGNVIAEISSKYKSIFLDYLDSKHRIQNVGDIIATKNYIFSPFVKNSSKDKIKLTIKTLYDAYDLDAFKSIINNSSLTQNKVLIKSNAKLKVVDGSCKSDICEFYLEEVLK